LAPLQTCLQERRLATVSRCGSDVEPLPRPGTTCWSGLSGCFTPALARWECDAVVLRWPPEALPRWVASATPPRHAACARLSVTCLPFSARPSPP